VLGQEEHSGREAHPGRRRGRRDGVDHAAAGALPMPSAWSPRRMPDHVGAGWALKAKRVPTLFWMNASGRRAAIAWIAFQPVQ
jgi:hypothetical protein